MKNVKSICPYIGKECIEDGTLNEETGQIEACPFWVVLQGKNPQDGTPINDGKCAVAWTPILLIENTKHLLHKDAATESERNETVKAIGGLASAISEASKLRLIGGNGG